MDRLLTNKLIADRARARASLPSPTEPHPPPPYTASESASDTSPSDEDSDPEDDPPLRLTINAQQAVHGNNNLVPTSPTPLADATKFSAVLLGVVRQAQNEGRVRVELTINCGITIVGDRNVVGGVGLRPKVSQAVVEGTAAATAAGEETPMGQVVLEAKRKADGETGDEQPASKRHASEVAPAET